MNGDRQEEMKRVRGHYCLIQYCPDHFRQEAVNVGLAVFVEGSAPIVRTTRDFRRVKDVFRVSIAEIEALTSALVASENRLNGFRTVAEYAYFQRTRANDVVLTPPRLVKLANKQSDFEVLYDRWVKPPYPKSLTDQSHTAKPCLDHSND